MDLDGPSLDPHGNLYSQLRRSGLTEEIITQVVGRGDFSEQLADLIRRLSETDSSCDLQGELSFSPS